MFRIFLNHQLKSFLRSRNQAGNIAVRIMMGLLIINLLLVSIAAGYNLNEMIASAFPRRNVTEAFYELILYYFLADFLIRTQLQELPTLSIVPYLHLNIRKKELVNFLNIKSLFSAFNLIPILFFFPFIIRIIVRENGFFAGIMVMISILSLVLFNNFLVLYLKRKSISNILYLAIGIVIIGGLAALEYFEIIPIAAFANNVFIAIAAQPLFALGFTFIAATMFVFNARYLRHNLFIEELSKNVKSKTSTDYPFLNRFGKTGELAALELKLILRHKRPRNVLMMGLIFFLYGFLMYKPGAIANKHLGMSIFTAIFITGIFITTYGQFMFGWQSAHFDGILTSKVNFKTFIKAKFLLFTMGSSALTLLSFFYGFISLKLVFIEFAVYLYNIGFSTVIVLFFAMFNYNRIDITKGAAFNWQGSNGTQMFMSIPLLLFPFLIYLPFYYLRLQFWGVAAIGIFGVITLLMRNIWVDVLTKKFEKQRYKIAEGFRE